mgnify:CR=1 FL=1
MGWYYNSEYHPHKPQCKWLWSLFLGESQFLGKTQTYVIFHFITHIPYFRYIIYLSHLSIFVIWDNIWYLYHLSISWYDRYISRVVIQIGLNSNSKTHLDKVQKVLRVMPHGRPISNISYSDMSWHDTATSLSQSPQKINNLILATAPCDCWEHLHVGALY